jgi:hypothetical protein
MRARQLETLEPGQWRSVARRELAGSENLNPVHDVQPHAGPITPFLIANWMPESSEIVIKRE